MSIEQWWTKLQPSTREYLIDNNGDVVPAEVVAEIAEVGGPESTDSWWADQNGAPGSMLLSSTWTAVGRVTVLPFIRL
jgi:hypothetical protein